MNDINSAYPYAISKIPDLSQGKWIQRKSIHLGAKMGFFRILADIPDEEVESTRQLKLYNRRIIPAKIKQPVGKRDDGKCVQCESIDNLHFDHIIPPSKDGSSISAENIQILCTKHHLEKQDNIA
jgi:hypothetical protein